MGSSVLYTLKKGVPLLTDFSVDPLQAPYMTTFEIYSTYMANAVEQIMPESGILKQFWLPIKAIFMQLTCKIIEYVLWWFLQIFVQGGKYILPSFTTIYAMEPIGVTMDWAKPEEYVTKSPIVYSGEILLAFIYFRF